MRADALGLFWQDRPKPPPPKREPPPRTWEEPGYLPRLEEARAFDLPLYDLAELEQARLAREPLLFDIEIYPNYFLAAFKGMHSGKVGFFEMGEDGQFNRDFLRWILTEFLIVTFNGNYFDIPITSLALAGLGCAELKRASDELIVEGAKWYQVLKSRGVRGLKLNTVDLIKPAPLSASLKIYAARLHAPRLQELPFKPSTILTEDQKAIVRLYCCGFDLPNTGLLAKELWPQIELRAQMGPLYGVDLRSKSDAQMSETIISYEIGRINGCEPRRPEIAPGTIYRYKLPPYVKFKTPQMQEIAAKLSEINFTVAEHGGIESPPDLTNLQIKIGEATYTMGIGGLHSNETCATYVSDERYQIIDRDVASYYPAVILNLKLFPQHIGPAFLNVYRSLVERRLAAKKAGRKMEAATLKIAVNGTFGKLGNKWSPLYAPDLLTQVTITGQLCLLMAIEGAGFKVLSANTDGIISLVERSRQAEFDNIIKLWEQATGFTTEDTLYSSVHSRDVNNYIAIKQEGGKADANFLDERLGCKTKGTYSERGSAGDSVLSKNPESMICNDAVIELLTKGTDLMTTIRACRDIRRFVTVRTVDGGAVKDGVYLGKAIRWYFPVGGTGEIIYARSGNKVANTDGACPISDLPSDLPADLDYDRYLRIAEEIMYDIGAWQLM